MTHKIITYVWLVALTVAMFAAWGRQNVHWSMTARHADAIMEIAENILLTNKKK